MNRIVARFQDGRVMKGVSADFVPTKGHFHLTPDAAPGVKPIQIQMADLKAVFFVRDFAGDKAHVDLQEFAALQPVAGRRIRVQFKDGELLIGTTQAYQPGRAGFFIVPADADSNNERAYIVTAATREVTLL
jgi:hypothetical protein